MNKTMKIKVHFSTSDFGSKVRYYTLYDLNNNNVLYQGETESTPRYGGSSDVWVTDEGYLKVDRVWSKYYNEVFLRHCTHRDDGFYTCHHVECEKLEVINLEED